MSRPEGITQNENVWKQGAEKNVRTFRKISRRALNKVGECSDQLSDHQLLQESSAPWRQKKTTTRKTSEGRINYIFLIRPRTYSVLFLLMVMTSLPINTVQMNVRYKANCLVTYLLITALWLFASGSMSSKSFHDIQEHLSTLPVMWNNVMYQP
jgi:hypothetical protein